MAYPGGRNGIFFSIAAAGSAFLALAYSRSQNGKLNTPASFHVKPERSGGGI
ncbi:hypothetical protein B0A48_14017 [Cryoendolithus antarcticus]|uniref:Uncharacterized protein n=1 Tax=Cryoendolithus antarcticus TaxID=1507870 RepID=A0A1V8SMC3_9PEZI|nr:hypothetical protein B0A48_14017 [Cryoendolithus antarcticus]